MAQINLSISGIEQLNGMASRVEAAIEPALDAAFGVLERQKARQIGNTYKRAIPRSKTGRPKWKRSGDFQRGQVVKRSRGERSLGPEGNAAKYEGRLADLPTGADGVNRSNPAAQRTVEITEPQLGPVFESAIKNALGI